MTRLEELNQLFKDLFNNPNIAIEIDSMQGDFPEWDSIGQMDIIRAIEEKYAIDIPFEDQFEMDNVHQIIQVIEKLK